MNGSSSAYRFQIAYRRCWICGVLQPRPERLMVQPGTLLARMVGHPTGPLVSGRHWVTVQGIWIPLWVQWRGGPLAMGFACSRACADMAAALLDGAAMLMRGQAA